MAARDQVVAVPTLIRRFPGPPRRIIGDLYGFSWLGSRLIRLRE